jgi:hypothetical protein
MAHYSEEDQPQLQWLEDMIVLLYRGFIAVFVAFGRSMAAAWSSMKKDD